MAAAAKAAAKKRPAAAKQGAILWWGGLGCGALVVLSPGSAAVLAALLVPVVFVGLLPDETRSGRVMRASALFGLAASIRPLRQLWDGGGTMDAAFLLLHQPVTLFTAWTAIAAGWFVSECAAVVLRLIAEMTELGRRRAITVAIAELEEEWGPLHPPARDKEQAG